MKKFTIIASAILLAFSLVSCKKIDSSAWLSNLDDAKKAASNENKKIFLFFSADDMDEVSADLKQRVFNTEEFIKTYTEKYVLVNLDYSDSRYEAEQDGLRGDMKIFEKYNAQGVPYFLIISKEGYVITSLAFETGADLDTARITFEEAEETIASFDEKLAKTKNGTKEERLAAINDIFDNTDAARAYHLTPLNKLYLSLDKNNETGECAKHLIALSYAKAEDYFLDDEPVKASEEFASLAKNKILKPEEKQMAYYTSGYFLAQTGSTEYEKIKDLFQKAYDAAPDTDEAQNIVMTLKYVQMLIDGEGDEAPALDDEAISEEEAQ